MASPVYFRRARARARVRGLGHEGGVGCSPEGHSGWSRLEPHRSGARAGMWGFWEDTASSVPASPGWGRTQYLSELRSNQDPTRSHGSSLSGKGLGGRLAGRPGSPVPGR